MKKIIAGLLMTLALAAPAQAKLNSLGHGIYRMQCWKNDQHIWSVFPIGKSLRLIYPRDVYTKIDVAPHTYKSKLPFSFRLINKKQDAAIIGLLEQVPLSKVSPRDQAYKDLNAEGIVVVNSKTFSPADIEFVGTKNYTEVYERVISKKASHSSIVLTLRMVFRTSQGIIYDPIAQVSLGGFGLPISAIGWKP